MEPILPTLTLACVAAAFAAIGTAVDTFCHKSSVVSNGLMFMSIGVGISAIIVFWMGTLLK